jgi:Zn-dependent peptidase ImmA (M78 family)
MPKINHKILSWARKTAELSLEDAAHKLQIKDGKAARAQEKLEAYEDGTDKPSRALLLRMTKAYHRPLLTFYLNKPPRIGDRGEDFRTLPDLFEREDNAYVDTLIRDVKARQSLVSETLIEEDEGIKLSFVGSAKDNRSIDQVTQILRQVLNVDLSEFRDQSNYGDAFKFLRQKAEEAGFFVLLKGNLGSYHTNINVEAFRGFALSDDIAPFVVINDRDAKSAWSFTLLHEVVHVLLGQTGISGDCAEKRVEKFCNDVASEFLLPKEEFIAFDIQKTSIDDLSKRISQYAFSKKISSAQIAYRLYRKGDINKKQWEYLSDFYRQQWLAQREKDKVKTRDQKGGPSYYVVHKYKLGALVELAQRLNYAGALSTTKAGILLDIKPLKVHRLFETGQIA